VVQFFGEVGLTTAQNAASGQATDTDHYGSRKCEAFDQPGLLRPPGFRRLFDSIVAAFVVRKPVSCKFILRGEFDTELMPVGFVAGD
jgi:hypothetical protein